MPITPRQMERSGTPPSEEVVDDTLVFAEELGSAAATGEDFTTKPSLSQTLTLSRKPSLTDAGDAEFVPLEQVQLRKVTDLGNDLVHGDFGSVWESVVAYTKRKQFRVEVLSGITVALALVPEAVAFSFVAKVDPSVGLTAAWIICVLTSWLGGRPGMISAATGSMAAVMPPFVEKHGTPALFYAVMICGLVEMFLGIIKAGSLTNLIPESVMIGFCNGLAIVIGLAQKELFHEGHEKPLVTGSVAVFMGIEVVITMAIVKFLPNLTTIVPSSLAGIVVVMIFELALVRPAFNVETPVVEDFASLGGEFPVPVWFSGSGFDMPHLLDTPDLLGDAIYLGCTLAAIGLIESLMTLKLIDEITNTRGGANRECFGQGVANFVTGILGGMGGCAMIGQSMINMNAGARERLSSTTAGIFLLVIILAAYPLINYIPTSSLAGVMFMVVIETFEWSSLQLMFMAVLPQSLRERLSDLKLKVRRGDAFVILLTTVVTLVSNLAIAVFCGIILSCILYVWEQKTIEVEIYMKKSRDGRGETKIYDVKSPLLFSSATAFQELFDPSRDPDNVEVHFHQAAVSDYSALHALSTIEARYHRAQKKVSFIISHVKSVQMIQKATGLLESFKESYTEQFTVSSIDPLLNVQKRGMSPNLTAKEGPDALPMEPLDLKPNSPVTTETIVPATSPMDEFDENII